MAVMSLGGVNLRPYKRRHQESATLPFSKKKNLTITDNKEKEALKKIKIADALKRHAI